MSSSTCSFWNREIKENNTYVITKNEERVLFGHTKNRLLCLPICVVLIASLLFFSCPVNYFLFFPIFSFLFSSIEREKHNNCEIFVYLFITFWAVAECWICFRRLFCIGCCHCRFVFRLVAFHSCYSHRKLWIYS